jgi:hypothetical protein
MCKSYFKHKVFEFEKYAQSLPIVGIQGVWATPALPSTSS